MFQFTKHVGLCSIMMLDYYLGCNCIAGAPSGKQTPMPKTKDAAWRGNMLQGQRFEGKVE